MFTLAFVLRLVVNSVHPRVCVCVCACAGSAFLCKTKSALWEISPALKGVLSLLILFDIFLKDDLLMGVYGNMLKSNLMSA